MAAKLIPQSFEISHSPGNRDEDQYIFKKSDTTNLEVTIKHNGSVSSLLYIDKEDVHPLIEFLIKEFNYITKDKLNNMSWR